MNALLSTLFAGTIFTLVLSFGQMAENTGKMKEGVKVYVSRTF